MRTLSEAFRVFLKITHKCTFSAPATVLNSKKGFWTSPVRGRAAAVGTSWATVLESPLVEPLSWAIAPSGIEDIIASQDLTTCQENPLRKVLVQHLPLEATSRVAVEVDVLHIGRASHFLSRQCGFEHALHVPNLLYDFGTCGVRVGSSTLWSLQLRQKSSQAIFQFFEIN
eukprot:2228091-Amphidinium_carterae.1